MVSSGHWTGQHQGIITSQNLQPLTLALFTMWTMSLFQVWMCLHSFHLYTTHNLQTYHQVMWYELINPVGVSITTLTYPVTDLNYPAITVCKKVPYNPDEYVRTVFDNFQLGCNKSCTEYCDCEETKKLRHDFEPYLQANPGGLCKKMYGLPEVPTYLILRHVQTPKSYNDMRPSLRKCRYFGKSLHLFA